MMEYSESPEKDFWLVEEGRSCAEEEEEKRAG
jgi:hypothetical protein